MSGTVQLGSPSVVPVCGGAAPIFYRAWGLPASRRSPGWADALFPGAGADPRCSPLRSTRLAMLSNNLTHWKKLPLLPSLTNQPHQVLASDPVPFADLQQVRGWGGSSALQPALGLPSALCGSRSVLVLGGAAAAVVAVTAPACLWQPGRAGGPWAVPAAALAVFTLVQPCERNAGTVGSCGCGGGSHSAGGWWCG